MTFLDIQQSYEDHWSRNIYPLALALKGLIQEETFHMDTLLSLLSSYSSAAQVHKKAFLEATTGFTLQSRQLYLQTIEEREARLNAELTPVLAPCLKTYIEESKEWICSKLASCKQQAERLEKLPAMTSAAEETCHNINLLIETLKAEISRLLHCNLSSLQIDQLAYIAHYSLSKLIQKLNYIESELSSPILHSPEMRGLFPFGHDIKVKAPTIPSAFFTMPGESTSPSLDTLPLPSSRPSGL